MITRIGNAAAEVADDQAGNDDYRERVSVRSRTMMIIIFNSPSASFFTLLFLSGLKVLMEFNIYKDKVQESGKLYLLLVVFYPRGVQAPCRCHYRNVG